MGPVGGGTSSAAFARQSNLDEWVADGSFPKIHDSFFRFFEENASPVGAILDLGCSTGLLGRRVADQGHTVLFADGDDDALDRGIAAGVMNEEQCWRGLFTNETWPDLMAWALERGVRTVLARRVACVLADHVDPDTSRRGFAEIGIQLILLEGQRQDPRNVRWNGHVDAQAQSLEPDYKVAANDGKQLRLCSLVRPYVPPEPSGAL